MSETARDCFHDVAWRGRGDILSKRVPAKAEGVFGNVIKEWRDQNYVFSSRGPTSYRSAHNAHFGIICSCIVVIVI